MCEKIAAPPAAISAPQPRKSPRQQRSQATVSYIIEAARRILHEEGADAVTTRHIAERSGVAVGSLYQYFPNRDAILAVLAEEEVHRQLKTAQQLCMRLAKLPLGEFLARTLEHFVAVERHMLAFGGDFYRKYAHHYRIAYRLGERQNGNSIHKDAITHETLRALELHKVEMGEPNRELAAYLLARGIIAMLGNLVAERPDLLASPRLSVTLGRIAAAIVDTDVPEFDCNSQHDVDAGCRSAGPPSEISRQARPDRSVG